MSAVTWTRTVGLATHGTYPDPGSGTSTLTVMKTTSAARVLLTALVSVLIFLGTMGGTCDDVGGVPVWDRCTSWLGTPLIVDWPSGIWDLTIPLAIAFVFGSVAWWLIGKSIAPKQDA